MKDCWVLIAEFQLCVDFWHTEPSFAKCVETTDKNCNMRLPWTKPENHVGWRLRYTKFCKLFKVSEMIIQCVFAALSNRALSWTSSRCCGLLQAASCFDGVWWCRCSVEIFHFRQTSYRQMRSQAYPVILCYSAFLFSQTQLKTGEKKQTNSDNQKGL